MTRHPARGAAEKPELLRGNHCKSSNLRRTSLHRFPPSNLRLPESNLLTHCDLAQTPGFRTATPDGELLTYLIPHTEVTGPERVKLDIWRRAEHSVHVSVAWCWRPRTPRLAPTPGRSPRIGVPTGGMN